MALKLLIFVPSHTDAVSIHHELTTNLAKCLNEKAEVEVVTSAEKEKVSDFSNIDILNIFGCWSHSACQVGAKAYKEHVPYIVTPLGGLQPWEMEHHSYSVLAKEQQTLVRRASAVHVCGKLEEQTFAKLGWNQRTALIKNPVLTSQTTFVQAADSMLGLYRKVLDSNARLLLNKDTRKIIGQLLQAGIDDKASVISNEKDLEANIEKLTDEDWRRLWIYADDEHITEPLRKALKNEYYIEASTIDRFDRDRGYSDGHLKNDMLLSRNLLLRNKVKDIFDEHQRKEQMVCLSLLNLQYEITRHKAPLLHLADFYTMLRFTDMDEDSVRDMVKRLKLEDFSVRLMSVMEDFLGLTEGFMPFADKKGRATRRLYKNITKFGTYI